MARFEMPVSLTHCDKYKVRPLKVINRDPWQPTFTRLVRMSFRWQSMQRVLLPDLRLRLSTSRSRPHAQRQRHRDFETYSKTFQWPKRCPAMSFR